MPIFAEMRISFGSQVEWAGKKVFPRLVPLHAVSSRGVLPVCKNSSRLGAALCAVWVSVPIFAESRISSGSLVDLVAEKNIPAGALLYKVF